MGKIPKIRATLKTMKKFIPAMRCSDAAVISMQYAIQMVKHLTSNKIKLDNHWMSKELEMKMIELVSNEDFYDCLPGEIGFCYFPKFEGGYHYNLMLKADSEDNTMSKFDTIQCSISFKLKNYCCSLIRTIAINPTDKINENMHFAAMVFDKIVINLRDGVELCEVAKAVQSFAQEKDPILASHLDKNFGFLLDSKFQQKQIMINQQTSDIAQKDMIFVTTVNLVGLKEDEREYNLCFSDTVAVRKDKSANILTYTKRKGKSLNLKWS